MEQKSKDQFTGKIFGRLWAPAMASSLTLAVADMADAIVVGQKMGAAGLAAISLALPVYMVVNVFVHGMGIGGSVRYSRLLGEGKEQEAVSGFNQMLKAALIISFFSAVLGNVFLEQLLFALGVKPADGTLFFVSRDYVRIILSGMPVLFLSYLLNYYLRNDNSQKLAGVGFTIGNLADFGMNVLFVLILDFGAAGAAMSTVLGQLISVMIYLPATLQKKHALRFMSAKIEIREAAASFRTGFSTSVQYIWQMFFLLIANHTLMHYSGEAGVAVFDMVQNVSYIILYLYDGTAKAMQPLTSTYQGEYNEKGCLSVKRMGILYGTAVGIVASVLLALFPETMCVIFGLEGEAAVSMASYAIRIYCLGGVFGGISVILEGYYQSCKEEGLAFYLATLRGAAVLIPCTILFAPLGLEAFWFLFPATEIISLVCFLFLKKITKRKEPFDRKRVYSRTIEGKNDDLGLLLEEVEAFCKTWKAEKKQRYFVTMTIEEICLLIIEKAFENQSRGYIQVTLAACLDNEFELHIRDNARMFNPFSMETNKASREGSYDMDAMGIFVIRQKAKHFFYRQYQGFNTLIVRI